MDQEESLHVALGIVERVMATLSPGRDAFYALTHARREIGRARHDIQARTGRLWEDEHLPRA